MPTGWEVDCARAYLADTTYPIAEFGNSNAELRQISATVNWAFGRWLCGQCSVIDSGIGS